MTQHEQPPRRRSAPSTGSADGQRARWKVRRTGKPWQRFLERFGFTLIAIGIAMFVGVLIARLG